LFVDAKVEKVRDGGRVARKCVVIAHAVHESGRWEIIGLEVGEAETEPFWREFCARWSLAAWLGFSSRSAMRTPG
jgi:transposase-like protein